MSPWRLPEDKPESAAYRFYRGSVATLLLGGGLLSLFISPMPWRLVSIYVCLGIFAGILARIGQVGGFIALAILLLGVPAATNTLDRFEPAWRAAWWQPILISVAAMVAVEYVPKMLRRLHRS